jgi:uncharacterized protein YjgD (DUF1641 family)
MAKPQDSYPETATNAASNGAGDPEGEAALRAALGEHGEELAALVDRTDEAGDLLTTAVIVAASADDAELDHITESTANLVEAADGLTTEGAAALATTVGEDADDMAAALETVLALQRAGHLDDLVTVASAFAASLSPDEVAELADMLERDGAEAVEGLDTVLELQRSGDLDALVDLASTLSVLEVDADAARGLNTALSALGEAERDSEPVGLFGALRQLGGRDARAGLGYVLAVLKGTGRRIRER